MAKWGKENARKGQIARKLRPPLLTERERIFAQGIVAGLSHVAAIRKAGYGSGTTAKDVLVRPQVVRYLAELRERQVTRLDYSIDNLCARLEYIAHAAVDEGQYAPAVAAVMGIAKMMGHLADKTEIEMHIISKPAREPTKEVTLSPEDWQRQFAPKLVQ